MASRSGRVAGRAEQEIMRIRVMSLQQRVCKLQKREAHRRLSGARKRPRIHGKVVRGSSGIPAFHSCVCASTLGKRRSSEDVFFTSLAQLDLQAGIVDGGSAAGNSSVDVEQDAFFKQILDELQSDDKLCVGDVNDGVAGGGLK